MSINKWEENRPVNIQVHINIQGYNYSIFWGRPWEHCSD